MKIGMKVKQLNAYYTYNKSQFLRTAYLAKIEDNRIVGYAKPVVSTKYGKVYANYYNPSNLPNGIYVMKSMGRFSLWEIKDGEATLIKDKYTFPKAKTD